MPSMDEKYHEQACALTDWRRDEAMRLAHEALLAPGQDTCEDCGCEIPPLRRKASPSAIRCVACQAVFERTFSK